MEGRDGYEKPVLTTHSVLFIIADPDSQWCVRDGGWLVVGRWLTTSLSSGRWYTMFYTMVGGRWPPVWPATDLRDLRNPPQSPVGPRRGKFKARVISALLLLISKPSLVLSFSLVMVWGKIKTSKQSENGVEFYLISCLHLICMFDGLNLTLPCHVFFCWRKGLTFAWGPQMHRAGKGRVSRNFEVAPYWRSLQMLECSRSGGWI